MLHAQPGPDFFSDTHMACTAGDLLAEGINARVVHVYFERGGTGAAAANAAIADELVASLVARAPGLVVVEHCWDDALLARLQREAGAIVVETDPWAVHQTGGPDLRLAHLQTHREPLLTLARRLVAGAPLDGITNLRDGGGSPLGPERMHPPRPDSKRPFRPLLRREVIGRPRDAMGQPHVVRRTLDTNAGCPFSKPAADNPVFEGVDLSADGVARQGCAFCELGGDYKALPWRETVATHTAQICTLQRELDALGSPLQEVVLRDQHALRYLPELVAALLDADAAPVGLLVPGRGDAILRFGEQLERAAQLATGTGHWFTIYLIGFESFSQPQLDLYNKGVTVAEYAEAIARMRALQARYPDAFALDRYAGSSFILFNPWTTLDDLEATVAFCKEHGAHRFAQGMTLTRLRLYPNLPLYWKARADGLLALGGEAPDDRGAAYTGYSAEAPWRYQHPTVAIAEDIQRRLHAHVRPTEGVGLLEAAVRFARAWVGPAETFDADALDALEARWLALRARWQRTDRQRATVELAGRGEAALQRTAAHKRRTLLLGAACNNACRSCVGHHDRFETDTARLQRSARDAASGGRLVVAGREPTLLRDLPQVLRHAQRAGAERIELVTNGRALSVERTAQLLARAGLTEVLLKRHRLEDDDEDAITAAPGSGAQNRAAMATLQRAGLRWSLLWVPVRGGLADGPALVRAAAAAGAHAVQIRVLTAEVALDALDAWGQALDDALATAQTLGLRVAIEGP